MELDEEHVRDIIIGCTFGLRFCPEATPNCDEYNIWFGCTFCPWLRFCLSLR